MPLLAAVPSITRLRKGTVCRALSQMQNIRLGQRACLRHAILATTRAGQREAKVGDCTDNLYWWKPRPLFRIIPRPHNLGDALSPYIVRCVLKSAFPQKVSHPSHRRILAIGSVLNHAGDGNIVWGSGINGIKSREDYHFRQLDVRAVRGPRTREFLLELGVECPAIFGDPGILISRFLTPVGAPTGDELYIPHYSQGRHKRSDMRTLLTFGTDFQEFTNVIGAARIAYSASLHGLIIAEAFGIPAILTMTSRTENMLKYNDYYEGTGRTAFPVAYSVEEARGLTPPPLPDVAEIQDRLLQSFPYDAW